MQPLMQSQQGALKDLSWDLKAPGSIVTASDDGSVCVWDAQVRQMAVMRLCTHTVTGTALACRDTPFPKSLYAVSEDSALAVLRQGALLAVT